MTKTLLQLHGLKWNPFAPDVPTEALLTTPRIESFGWRVEHLAREGGFAAVLGDPGTGKSVTLRLLAARPAGVRDGIGGGAPPPPPRPRRPRDPHRRPGGRSPAAGPPARARSAPARQPAPREAPPRGRLTRRAGTMSPPCPRGGGQSAAHDAGPRRHPRRPCRRQSPHAHGPCPRAPPRRGRTRAAATRRATLLRP